MKMRSEKVGLNSWLFSPVIREKSVRLAGMRTKSKSAFRRESFTDRPQWPLCFPAILLCLVAHLLVIFSLSGGYQVPQLTSEERTVCKMGVTGSLPASLTVKLSTTFHTPQDTQLPP